MFRDDETFEQWGQRMDAQRKKQRRNLFWKVEVPLYAALILSLCLLWQVTPVCR